MPDARYTSLDRMLVLLIAALLGGTLLWQALPLSIGYAVQLPVNSTAEASRTGKTLTQTQLRQLYDSRIRATKWLDLPQPWFEAAVADMLGSNTSPDPEARAAQIDRAIVNLRESLRRNPASPQAWYGLAQARFIQAGPGPGAAAALAMSFRTGPFIHALALPRMRLAVQLWVNFTPEERALVKRQIPFSLQSSPKELTILAAQVPLALDLVRNALGPDSSAYRNFRLHVGYRWNELNHANR